MGWTIGNSNSATGKRFFSSLKHPNFLWSPLKFLTKRYGSTFLEGKVDRA
jgi:hypothetical protein